MKKRLLFFQLCMMFAGSILQASMPLQYATLSKIYNEPFIPQVEQSAQLGAFGTLDQTLNNDQSSLGSIDLSLQLPTGSSRAVVALPHDNFLVAINLFSFCLVLFCFVLFICNLYCNQCAGFRARLAENPPTPIVQNYYTCYPTEWSTLSQSIGIGTGDAAFWMGLVSLLISPTVYLLLQVSRIKNKSH